MQLALMVAIESLIRAAFELHESTKLCTFVRFSGHVDKFEIEVISEKHWKDRKQVYYREFDTKDKKYRKADDPEDVYRVVKLLRYIINLETQRSETDVPCPDRTEVPSAEADN